MDGLDADGMERFVDQCAAQGVGIKWFGRSTPQGFTSTWQDWRYVGDAQELPRTRQLLDSLFDMRIPLDLTDDDCKLIAGIISNALHHVSTSARSRLAR